VPGAVGQARLIAALSIYSVGETMAEVLADEFGSLDAVVAASPEELARARGFGPKRAQFVRQYFDSDIGKRTVAELKALGLKTTQDRKAAPAGGLPLAGKTIVVTGSLVNYKRDEIGHRRGRVPADDREVRRQARGARLPFPAQARSYSLTRRQDRFTAPSRAQPVSIPST
jgi:NAD-dependent DNA ligase